MGHGCTRTVDRIGAATGAIDSAESIFEHNNDIPLGGLLLAIPALLENGLLKYLAKYYKLKSGFYSIVHIFLTLAFMALARLKSPENIRNTSPAEFGKLLGLDRTPEVKTLRNKLTLLSSQEKAKLWSLDLSKDWMNSNPDVAGVLYVDGHIQVYNGKLTKLPRKYVSRQRLCLRGVANYWVNDLLGQPFFVVQKTIDSGMINTLRDVIVPELIKSVPAQPSADELKANKYLSKFGLVFDREGYSPAFFAEMWEKRIACTTYRKYATDVWNILEFHLKKVILSNGELTEMYLAERGTLIGKKVWVREVRKLTNSGHQTAIISTNFTIEYGQLAVAMFSRWCQENFFKYMMQHYGIDRLIEYETEEISDTTEVINPKHRKLSSNIKSVASKLQRRRAEFMAIEVEPVDPDKTIKKIIRKAELLEEIELYEKELIKLKAERKTIEKHIKFGELLENEKFKSLSKEKKNISDTIKLISYRAETALVDILREQKGRNDESRNLIRKILTSEANLKPDFANKFLYVSIHNFANAYEDKIVKKLCEELTQTETVFPGTNLRIVYDLVVSKNP